MMIKLDPDVDQYIVSRAGEQKIIEVPKHWAACVAPLIRMILGLILCGLAVRLEGFWYWLVLYFGWCLVFESFWRHLRIYRDRFTLTTTKIMRFQGVINDHRSTLPIGRVVDIDVNRSWLGKMWNYGHLDFAHIRLEMAGQLNDFQKIKFIRDINRIEEILRIIASKKKFDQAYEDWQPGEIQDVLEGK